MPRGNRAAHGFTLVEVMVALFVVALSLPALLKVTQQQVDGAAALRDKSQATLVAANKLVEVRLLAREGKVPDRTVEGESEMAERRWRWWLDVKATDVDRLRRLEVRVAPEEGSRDRPVATLVGFVLARDDDGVRR